MEDLDEALSRHRALPFPSAVEKGRVYGRIEPVMIDADIYGWAETASTRRRAGRGLDHEEVVRLRSARADLAASMAEIPASAASYYESVLTLADLAITTVGEDA